MIVNPKFSKSGKGFLKKFHFKTSNRETEQKHRIMLHENETQTSNFKKFPGTTLKKAR